MSPRKTRKLRPAAPAAPLGPERIEDWPDGDWVVRQIPGAAATKAYRCPGCDHEILPATPHTVAWPVVEGLADRPPRHTPCGRARGRRPAVVA